MKKLKSRLMPYKTYFKMFIKKNWISLKQGQCTNKIGSISLKLLETCRLQFYHFNALARVTKYYCKDRSLLTWFPNSHFCVPLTKKSVGVRMGKGKGKMRHWCANFLKGTILAEFEVRSSMRTRQAFKQLLYRLPARARLVYRNSWLDV